MNYETSHEGLKSHRQSRYYRIRKHSGDHKNRHHLPESQHYSHIHEGDKVLISENTEYPPIRIKIKCCSIEEETNESNVQKIKGIYE